LSSIMNALLSSELFVPHGHCYLWKPKLLGLEIGANSIIALSGLAIAVTLAWLARRARERSVRLLYRALGAVIALSAVTHLFDIWVIWRPLYWMDGAVRALCALASLALALLAPRALARVEAAPPKHPPGHPPPS
jgi:hypothetical protein